MKRETDREGQKDTDRERENGDTDRGEGRK